MKRLAIILLIGLSACYSERKAKSQFSKAVVAYPQIPLDYCADQFPDKPDSVIVRTDTVTEVIINDPVLEVTDTAYFDTSNCKPITIIKTKTITIRKDSIIYRGPNLAEEKRLNLILIECQRNSNVLVAKLDEKDKLIAEWKKKAKTRWLWIALLIGGAAAYTAFKIFKFKLPINLKT